MKRWFFQRHQETFGPFSIEELRKLADTGKIMATDLVWREGMENTYPAKSVYGLFSTERQSQIRKLEK